MTTLVLTPTQRARAIWQSMRPVSQFSAYAAWQAGYFSWAFAQPCVNPYKEELSAELWAAFEMGWTACQIEHGGR